MISETNPKKPIIQSELPSPLSLPSQSYCMPIRGAVRFGEFAKTIQPKGNTASTIQFFSLRKVSVTQKPQAAPSIPPEAERACQALLLASPFSIDAPLPPHVDGDFILDQDPPAKENPFNHAPSLLKGSLPLIKAMLEQYKPFPHQT